MRCAGEIEETHIEGSWHLRHTASGKTGWGQGGGPCSGQLAATQPACMRLHAAHEQQHKHTALRTEHGTSVKPHLAPQLLLLRVQRTQRGAHIRKVGRLFIRRQLGAAAHRAHQQRHAAERAGTVGAGLRLQVIS